MEINLPNKSKGKTDKKVQRGIVKDNLRVVGLIEEDAIDRERSQRLLYSSPTNLRLCCFLPTPNFKMRIFFVEDRYFRPLN